MILTVDIGNSHIRLAFFDAVGSRTPKATLSLCARPGMSCDELCLIISAFLRERGIDRSAVTGAVVGSVVPALTPQLSAAVGTLFTGCGEIVTVRSGLRTGLDIRTDYQSELGADIVAAAVGARTLVAPPYAVVDLGTATTLSLVDKNGCFRGVAIMPGLSSGARALAAECAALPPVGIDVDITGREPLGRNTADSLTVGLIAGCAAMVDGMLARVGEHYGCAGEMNALICGGGASSVFPQLRTPRISLCPDLTALGLLRLWELNKKDARRA